MIARLKGIVDVVGEGWVVIDVSGVGYIAFCSSKTLARLSVGEGAVLEIETHVREDHIHLYGFIDLAERDWFKLLTTVQGVGAKVGLAILGIIGADELVQVVAAADKAAMTRAPGVGPKLATRILSELKDKVGAMALGPAVSPGVRKSSGGEASSGAGNTHLSDAASALVNLGYNPSDALGAVSRAAAEMGEQNDLEALIRAGLRELAPQDARS